MVKRAMPWNVWPDIWCLVHHANSAYPPKHMWYLLIMIFPNITQQTHKMGTVFFFAIYCQFGFLFHFGGLSCLMSHHIWQCFWYQICFLFWTPSIIFGRRDVLLHHLILTSAFNLLSLLFVTFKTTNTAHYIYWVN